MESMAASQLRARLRSLLPVSSLALRLSVALAALALILLPAEIWARADHDLRVRGFDAKAIYADEHGGRYLFAPFQVLTNGDWQACPCGPATQLVLVGNGLSSLTASSAEGASTLADLSILVDGKPTRMYLVSPTQVNFFLRADVRPPSSTISLQYQGREVGRQVIPIVGAATEQVNPRADITISRDKLRLLAAPAADPSVHLLTTPLSFRASFDVVVNGETGRPFQAMLWNPRNFGAINLVFGSDQRIDAFVTERGAVMPSAQHLGSYARGQPYYVEIAVDRGHRVDLRVGHAGDPLSERSATFTVSEAPAFFEAYRPSLTVLSQAADSKNDVTLTDYRLELPHARFLTDRVDDRKILPVVLILLALAFVLHVPLLMRSVPGALNMTKGAALSALTGFRRVWWWLTPTTIAFGAALGYLMTLGNHPFDMASQRVWTYLLVSGGFGDLYYRAQTVPLAAVWKGMPFHEGVYPYGVGMSYYFFAVGWLYRLVGGDVSPSSAGLAVAIKTANVMFAVADAGLLYLLARRAGSRRFAIVAPLVFLLNPAVLFDLAVWGETESVALFFLLGSLVAAQRGSARWAWMLLALSFLGKQTVVLPAFLTAIYYLRLFPLRRSLEGISIAVPAVVLVTLPYIFAGYPPSIAVDPILGAFGVFGGSEMERVFQVVSFDAYNVWPLVTLFRHGQHGLARLQFPDSTLSVGSLSYHQIGVFAFLGIIAALAVWLLATQRVRREAGLIFLVLSFATLAELVLPTRSISRYLLFPLVFTLISLGRASARKTMMFVVAALTLTSLIGMYGSVASGLQANPALGPHLAPQNSIVSRYALRLFQSDTVITIGSALNVVALVAVAYVLWPLRREPKAVSEWRPELGTMLAPSRETGR